MKRPLILPTLLTYLFLTALLIYFISIGNYEFIGYAIVVGFLWVFILYLDKLYNFPTYTIWLLALWIVMHMSGGSVYLSGTRLYDVILIPILSEPFNIFKFDQFVHLYLYFVVGVLAYHALKKHTNSNPTKAITIFAILAATGIGVLNEIIELGMAVFADASEAVGGYFNTALDLVFNFLGAVLGGIVASRNS